ncbi:MAG: hypothetical protein AAF404_10935 [Pseudomonadota bacterium]
MLNFIRALLLSLALYPLAAMANQSNGNAGCVDSDGDGWGWNGTSSCRVTDPAAGSSCVDPDGDGWGWNGSSSCRTDSQPASTPALAVCLDPDGDGWGWDGTASCQAESTEQPDNTGQADNNNAGGECVDTDGDGWGWGPSGSCQVSLPTDQPAVQNSGSTSNPSVPGGRLNPATDLVAAHFDHGPDPDDGHAAAAAYVIKSELNLDMVVVGGTTGVYSAGRYLPESESLMRRIWGQQWLDAHNNRQASAEQAARQWVATMAAGGDVWVAEGGPSDFTAAVVRIVRNQYPEFNTRQRVHVVQHSQWNEDHALREDLNYVRSNTRYIRIEDGNDPNATADLRQDGNSAVSNAFVQRVLGSRYKAVWRYAFDYLNPGDKLDFSDTVELLYILNIGTDKISNVTEFELYFLNR